MRVAVRQLRLRDQRAGGFAGGIDRVMRLEDVLAGEARGLRGEGAVVVHRLRHRQAMRAAEVEIVLAMAGGDMDEAGAGLGCDEIAGQKRNIKLVPAQ